MKAFYSVIPALAISLFFYSGRPDAMKNSTRSTGVKKTTGAQSCVFSNFRAHKQGKRISLSWSAFSTGPVSFNVEKTYSDPSDPYSVWEVVSDQPGNGARTYKASDDNVFPGYSNYRVTAIADDGSVIACSNVETVRVVGH